MQIATWNVNSIRSRLDLVIEWLQNNPVDVLCLQETKVIDLDFPLSPLAALGYHIYTSGQKSYNGVAILSRQPLESCTMGFAPILGTDDLDAQKRVITGIANGVRIVNLYVPNGSAVGSEKYYYKLEWLQALKEYLQLLLPTPMVICGDFNIALEERDIYRKTGDLDIMASPQERQALQAIVQLGLTDAFRKFTPDGGQYTWWDYRTGAFRQNRGWRIDHHYVTPELYERAISCTIDIAPRKLEKPSDHAPVVLTI
jgi:exodeoxyribonuclease III